VFSAHDHWFSVTVVCFSVNDHGNVIQGKNNMSFFVWGVNCKSLGEGQAAGHLVQDKLHVVRLKANSAMNYNISIFLIASCLLL
jgi:hypothetical protein